ncbi:MAG: DEAD/DEAH box helicase [Anaerolineae bacterium]|nr:DEAD/DEAH box helicase [Anaerolineae bacterium]
MSTQHTLDRLRSDAGFIKNVVAWQRTPARPARYAPHPAALDPALIDALRTLGTETLYTHQAAAVEAALGGENVVVVTGTASGKTLCYNLPALQACRRDPTARALYLFPTKALAQDQAAALDALVNALDREVGVHTFDGDTPSRCRAAVRRAAGIILSNPDMLHQGILPQHLKWETFFSNLRYVVIDEMHIYRGVFGSHMANVLRRLRRICAFYGSDPRFICTSATIANPQELAEKLIEAPVTLIDDDGSPQGERHFILYNPPVIDPALGLRASHTRAAERIAAEFLSDDVQTVVFARARLSVEVLLGYLRDAVARYGLGDKAVRGYRGGYLPNERREIEIGLRDGDVRGVVATNALELGIDIGALSAAVLAGYPGTIASARQQAGRAGRRAEVSAAALVCSSQPLDQYIAAHPRYLFERSPEHALINPDNLVILAGHLLCAVYELSFRRGERFGAFGDVTGMLEVLAEDRAIHASGDQFRWVSEQYPAGDISLRSSSGNTIVIQALADSSSGGRGEQIIGEIDRETAPLLVYEGAVYLHEGQQYLIEALDWENGLATARPADVDYYTRASSSTGVTILNEFDSAVIGDVVKVHGGVRVTWQASSYRVIRRYTGETLGQGVIDIPAQTFETTAYWLYLTPDLTEQLVEAGLILLPNDYGPDWPAQRDTARRRDEYRCRRCGIGEDEAGREHDVHHIQPFRDFGYVRGRNENYRQANRLDNLMTLCRSCHRAVEGALYTRSALSGLGALLQNLCTVHLMCAPYDLGVVVEQRSATTLAPTIIIYDNVAGGLGFSERLYEWHDDLLRDALATVRACGCTEGCPACVGPPGEVGAATKQLTEALLVAMLGEERS